MGALLRACDEARPCCTASVQDHTPPRVDRACCGPIGACGPFIVNYSSRHSCLLLQKGGCTPYFTVSVDGKEVFDWRRHTLKVRVCLCVCVTTSLHVASSTAEKVSEIGPVHGHGLHWGGLYRAKQREGVVVRGQDARPREAVPCVVPCGLLRPQLSLLFSVQH